MDILFLLVVFLALLLLRVPVAVAMGFSSMLYIICFTNLPWTILVSKMTAGVDKFSLIAVPLFILTALLMNKSGVTERLFYFARSIVGHWRGGLGHVNVVSSMIFAGMSGDPLADTAGLGLVEIKAMKEAGYPLDFSAAITAASARLGPIIPPSTIMVIYASLMDLSVGKMLLAGVVPGILLGILLMVTVGILAHLKSFPKEERMSFSNILKAFFSAFLPMMTPVIIVGGIAFGIFTPTEAAAIASLYAFILGFFVYRKLTLKDVVEVLLDTCVVTGIIMFIVSAAFIFSYIVTIAQIPDLVVGQLSSVFKEKWIVLIMLNIFFLVAGCFLNPLAILISTLGVLFPLCNAFNIDPIHLGVFMIFNLEIGGLTPPVAISMYIVSGIANVPFAQVLRAMLPFFIPLFVSLLLLTYLPQISLWLPNYLFR